MKQDADSWMVIGETAGAFGIKGEIKVQPLTDFPERFAPLERVFLGTTHREHAVERSRKHGVRMVLKLAGIDTPEAVTALGRVDIAVPRAEAVPLSQGEFYLDQLLGIAVRTSDNRNVGIVSDVLRTGSNDVWVIDGSDGQVLIPAITDAVVEINVDDGFAVIQPWVLQFEE